MSLGKKLLLGGIFLVSVPLVFVGLYAYFDGSRALTAAAQERTASTAMHLADLVQVIMEDEIKLMKDVSVGNTTLRTMNKVGKDGAAASATEIEDLDRKLAGFMKEIGQNYEAIFVADSKGAIISDGVGGSYKNISVVDRAYFKESMQGRPSAGEIVQSKKTGNPVAIVSTPIKEDGGQTLGVVVAALKLNFWEEKISRVKIGRTGYAVLVQSNTMVIAHPEQQNVFKTILKDVPGMENMSRRILNGESGFENHAFEGVEKTSGFAYVPLTKWTVIATQDRDEFLAPVRSIGYSILAVGAFGLVAAIILVFIFSRRFTGLLGRAVAAADAVSTGNLGNRLNYQSKDELGALAKSLDAMTISLQAKVDLASAIAGGDLGRDVVLASEQDTLGAALRTMTGSLNDLLSQVRDVSLQVAAGSGEVADSSQSLSQGASEQAASLEEISSSMTQVGAQTKTNAENASQANQLALGARDAAEQGNIKMRDMISAMTEINESSREIAKIIKAIDDIAFQTNLLALNAAVEAARAGKHGKGFAVVAQEVRNLAGRSAKAARETAELIDGSVKKVEKGAEIVNMTAESLGRIVEIVTKAADLIGEIASASNEQAQGITQINQGLVQVSQVTQQNTSTAEQAAAAAEELSAQAQQLRGLLSRFNLKKAVVGPANKRLPQAVKQEPREAASWGGPQKQTISMPREQKIRPEDIISLDEKDFGKY
ncbi:MAG: methyl-accepting chemotaxis protein [Pseudomonadota bacterium]